MEDNMINLSNDLDSPFSASSSTDKIINNLNCNVDLNENHVNNWSSEAGAPSAPSPGLVLFNSEDQSDLIFIVTMDSAEDEDNLKFPGHSFIIKDSSPIFKDIVYQIDQLQRSSSDRKPIINIQCRPETLHNLMSYIYKKEIILNSVTSCLALLDLSIKFMLTDLTSICLQFLCKNSTEFNVLVILDSLRKIDFKPFQSTHKKRSNRSKVASNSLVTINKDYNNNLIDCENGEDNVGDGDDSRGPRVTRSSSITSVICLSTEGQQPFPSFGDVNHNYHQIKHNHVTGSDEMIQNLVNELISKCYCILDEFAETIFSSEAICSIDRDLLIKILKRDSLKLSSELIAFQAIERWSVCECQRQLIEINGTNKMLLLGDAIYSVRYLTLPLMVFMRGPFASDILTETDKNYLQSKLLDPETKLPPHLSELGLDMKRKWTKPNTKSTYSNTSKSTRSSPKPTPNSSKKSSSSSSSPSSSPSNDQVYDRKKKPAIKKFLNGLGDVMIFAIRIFD